MTQTRRIVVASAAFVLALAGVVAASQRSSSQVGQVQDGATLLPDNQSVSPAGVRTEISNGRIISSSVSPDGTKLAALTQNGFLSGGLTIVDLAAGKVLQQVGMYGDTTPKLGDGSVTTDGPMYSPDGKTLWMSQGTDVLRLAVQSDGTVSTSPVATISIKATHGGSFGGGQGISAPVGDALPAGMALSQHGDQLYVALNGNNSLGVIDTETNTLVRQIPIGLAPRQVVLRGQYAYVSDRVDGSRGVATRRTSPTTRTSSRTRAPAPQRTEWCPSSTCRPGGRCARSPSVSRPARCCSTATTCSSSTPTATASR